MGTWTIPRHSLCRGGVAGAIGHPQQLRPIHRDYAADHPAYQPVNERHIAAPKASLQLIEMHGLLDAALDAKNATLPPTRSRPTGHEFYTLAGARQGTLSDVAPAHQVRFILTRQDPASTDGYAVHTEALGLPYLPDPWAVGVIFAWPAGTAA